MGKEKGAGGTVRVNGHRHSLSSFRKLIGHVPQGMGMNLGSKNKCTQLINQWHARSLRGHHDTQFDRA